MCLGEYHAHLAWCVHWHRRAQGTLVSARRLTRRPFALAGNDRPRTAIRARPRQLSACVSDGRLPTPATAVRRQPSAHTHGRRPHALARPHRPSTRTGNGRPRTVVRARLRQPSAQSACPASAFRAHRRWPSVRDRDSRPCAPAAAVCPRAHAHVCTCPYRGAHTPEIFKVGGWDRCFQGGKTWWVGA